MNRLKEK